MKTKTIAIFTTTRAEFGAFKPLLDEISKSEGLKYLLFVGGAHLREECGNTINDIKSQGYKITALFDYLDGVNSQHGLATAMGRESIALAQLFNEFTFDIVCVAGDRYELIPVALTSILFRKPILHLYGGEITEGVIDEQIRHMLTKSAHLHFTSCDHHSENVIKMGEESWRVFTTGELVVDVMAQAEKKSKVELFAEFDLDINKDTILLSYHPVANNTEISSAQQMDNIFQALKNFDLQVMITAPNVEVGSDEILAVIKQHLASSKHYRFCESLGFLRYYSFLSYAKCALGNSSSGILEAPFFKIPTVNVGARQQGRIRHSSIVDVNNSVDEIKAGLVAALDPSFQQSIQSMIFKLGDGFAAKRMVNILQSIEINSELLDKKLMFK